MNDTISGGRLLIHIGFHKTGTTFLQKQIFNDPHHGFICPVERHFLRNVFVSTNPFDFDPIVVREKLIPLIESSESNGLVPVLTHEQFSGQLSGGGYGLRRREREASTKEIADRLFSCFPGARILIIIREQKEMIRSIYKYLVCGWNGRLSASISEFLNQKPLKLGYSPLFNLQSLEYHQIIKYYQDLFGASNVLVLPYEMLQYDRIAYVNNIRKFMNMQNVDMVDNKRYNRGNAAITCQIRRWVNRILVSPNRPGLISNSEVKASRIVNKLSHFFPDRIHTSAEKSLINKIDRIVHGRYALSNEKTAVLTGIDLAHYGYEMPAEADAGKL